MTENTRNKATVIADADWPLLEAICRKAGVPAQVVAEMLECEARVFGMGRRHGLREQLQELITKVVEDLAKGGAR